MHPGVNWPVKVGYPNFQDFQGRLNQTPNVQNSPTMGWISLRGCRAYLAIAQNSQSEAVIKKIPVGVGVSVLSFLSRDYTKWSILEVKDNRRSLTWNIDLKNKKDGGGIGDKSFFRLHKKFCKFSPRGPPLTGSGKIDRENKNHMLGYSLV